MLLHELLRQSAARRPGSTALIHPRGRLSFAELDARTERLSAALGQWLAPGSTVGVVADNGPEWMECYYGIPRGGHILTMLNQRLSPQEQATLVERAGVRLVVGDETYVQLLRDLGLERDGVRLVTFGAEYERVIDAAPADSRTATDPDATAWLIFTSGTTGVAKGVRLSHRNLLTGAITTCLGRGIPEQDVYLFPFPLCHVAGYNVVAHQLRGCPVVLMPRFRVAEVLEAHQLHGATSWSLAPTMIHTLVTEVDDLDARLCGLRQIGYGSAAIDPGLLRRAMTALPNVDFTQGYGMTELSGIVTFLVADDHRRGLAGDDALLRSAGRPGPGVDLAVVDADGLRCPTGEPGEIVVRGDQVHRGYWNDDRATRESTLVLDGMRWLRTGDIGRLDDRGYLTVVDRLKDLVVTGGENVSSLEVEAVLRGCPGVVDVAVVAAPDPHWGEVVCAVVVPVDRTVTEDELVAFARPRLSGFKLPKRVVFTDELPRNHTGKVLKAQLRVLVGQP